MQAVIMAGGKGTRLTSITKDEIPKPMVDILGKPLLEWQIEQLKKYGVDEICFIIGHLGEKIEDYFGDGEKFGIHASYIKEEVPLGTAGAFYYLKKWIKDSQFILVFGDVFFDIDIDRMLEFHRNKGAFATLFAHPNSHPFDSDLLVLDEDSKVIRFDSKNNNRDYWYNNCVNAGFYIFDSRICDEVEEPRKIDLEKDILSKVVYEGKNIYGYCSPEYIKDIGTVDRINSTIKDINNGFIESRCLKNKQKCIFLDRDGTINVHKGLLSNIDDFELEKNVIDAIGKINHSEWLTIVVTNQPVVARGMCDITDVENIHKKMDTLLGEKGVYVDGVEFCPHHPDKGYPEENPLYKITCNCRKPDIGLIKKCAQRYNIDLEHSWIIGDTTIDLKTGENANMKKALVLTGEAGKDNKYDVKPDIIGDSLDEVVEKIFEYERGK